MSEATDRAPWHRERARPEPVEVRRRSFHLPMRDGVKIAVDLHLPARLDPGARLPTILRQTRYFRGVHLREPFVRLPIDWMFDHPARTRRRFLARGYAWVDVCVRGSGASFGTHPCPWSPEEVADGADVADWIVAQPWSNGRIGATGVSYDGTACEMLMRNRHPAVKAVVPRFSLYDVFADVAFPGGIHLAWFTETWNAFNQALDRNRLDRAFAMIVRAQIRAVRSLRGSKAGPLLALADSDGAEVIAERILRVLSTGVRRIDGDAGELIADAITAHADNFDVHRAALAVGHRDDRDVSPVFPEECIDHFSPHRWRDAIAGSGAAVLSVSGWLDGAYAGSAASRFRTMGGKLLLGPWDHGGLHQVSPRSPSSDTAFDHDQELLRFFDAELGDGEDDAPAVRYFTMIEERWKEAPSWPPPGAVATRLYLGGGRSLAEKAPGETGADESRVDREVGTGHRSRWNSLLGLLAPAGYSERAQAGERLLVYRGAPLDRATEVTGHPIISLWLSADTRDAFLFAYLEDERPDGGVDHVTEGQLRALHRRVSPGSGPYWQPGPYHSFERADAEPLEPGHPALLRFALLPVSWLFRAGHRIRLAVAGADRDHFAPPPHHAFAIHRGGAHASHIELPVLGR